MRYCLLFLLFYSVSSFGQSPADLDSLVEAGHPSVANQRIHEVFQRLTETGELDKLSAFLETYGRIQLALSDDQTAIEDVDIQINNWDKLLRLPLDKKNLWSAAKAWYEYLGMSERAYRAQLKTVEYAKMQPGISGKEVGILLVNLGGIAVNRMDVPAAKSHLAEAANYLETDPDPESVYRINSYLGSMAYYASKMDSAEYFFEKCLLAFEAMESTPRNLHYRPAIILNSLSGVQSAQGETSKAVASMNKTIDHLQSYQKLEPDPSRKMDARIFYYQSLDNLGGIYKGLGNYLKAQELLEHSYSGKKRDLASNSKEVKLSEIILGQLYYEQGEPVKAAISIRKGIEGLEASEGYFKHYLADGWFTLAKIEDDRGDVRLAEDYYKRAYALFGEVFEGESDPVYLGFLKSYSSFLASHKMTNAIDISREAYEYVKTNLGASSLLAFEHQLNIGEIHLGLSNHAEALKWSEIALNSLQSQMNKTSSLLDSLQNERYKPQAILLKAKSTFYSSSPSGNVLTALVEEMEAGLKVIERRRAYLVSDEDVALMMGQNADFFAFLELLYLELYKQNPNQQYLTRLLLLHESALYHRIRSRFEQLDISHFGDIPAEFFDQERKLKSRLRTSLESHDGNIQEYLAATSDWDKFLSEAHRTYPEYYAFRYGSLQRRLDDILDKLPGNVTVIRYLLVDNQLLALLITPEEKSLKYFPLDYGKVLSVMQNYQQEWNDPGKTFLNMNQLYQGLWKPLADDVKSQRVLIVPDGLLFNLNFEILTPITASSYSQLAQNSLLSKYSFSYNYSTLLFSYPKAPQGYQSNFAAFAPGFFDDMKSQYLSQVDDSIRVDRSYLALIPQPFTERLVKSLKDLLGGKIYSRQASTLDQFLGEVGKHRILHIGTHAESNNISPQYSRLIFAKNVVDEENSLYAKDIYQMDLASELAVLMACETGKPSFQPGEGMVSLAHAFNYAGSKSMLIGLWKIDEEASVKMGYDFYRGLVSGMTKDEALRRAKLQYLASAKGRALSPEFWAGLVVLGDAEAMELESETAYWVLVLMFLGLAVLGWVLLRKR